MSDALQIEAFTAPAAYWQRVEQLCYADRLAELETKLAEFETDAWSSRFRDMAAELAALLNALPPCPTCGATERSGEPIEPCADCLDTPGKVSIEQLAAIFCTLFDELMAVGKGGTVEGSDGALFVHAADLLKFLRGVASK